MLHEVIKEYYDDIVGIAIIPGSPLSISKGVEKFHDIIIFSLILGPIGFLETLVQTFYYKTMKIFSGFGINNNYSIKSIAKSFNIPVYHFNNLKDDKVINKLKELNIDLIINQSQVILKKDFLDIPEIGVINRHASLLPKNRGLRSPFWVLCKNEKYTGVSIHFVDRKIDHGPIIIQKKIKIEPFDTFLKLTKKLFKITPAALIEAISLIKNDPNYSNNLIDNNDELKTYNKKPKLKDVVRYYINLIKRMIFK